jgi:protein-tyrosine phosphatase
MKKILMVCMGNICRSPMAQWVTLHMARQAGLSEQIQVDSAGTRVNRKSEPPDPRAAMVLSGRGYALGKSRSRQVMAQDYERYDLILAMDQTNLNDLRQVCPGDHVHKLRLFLEFAQGLNTLDVPDPYFGSVQSFERVLDLCEAGASGLVKYYQDAPL